MHIPVFTERIKKVIIPSDATILNALRRMDDLQVKLLIVTENHLFKGLVSIGDIQRAIIRNVSLEEKISGILRQGIIYADAGTPFESIRKDMLSHRMEFMPVVNEYNELLTVHFWEEILGNEKVTHATHLNLPVVIMAGGKGTRLKPITNVLPKPLIPIGDKTILEHILDKFLEVGCSNFLMSVNYKAEMIIHYFDTLNNDQYQIEYFKEGTFLGTGGSLHLLKGRLTETFFVTNCDIIVETDYSEIYNYHKTHQNDITIVGIIKHYPIPYGVLETGKDGRLLGMEEKPDLTFKINSGMYILEPAMLDRIPDGQHYHITELIDDIRLNGGKVGVFPVSEGAWMDIGEWKEYNKTITKMGYPQLEF